MWQWFLFSFSLSRFFCVGEKLFTFFLARVIGRKSRPHKHQRNQLASLFWWLFDTARAHSRINPIHCASLLLSLASFTLYKCLSSSHLAFFFFYSSSSLFRLFSPSCGYNCHMSGTLTTARVREWVFLSFVNSHSWQFLCLLLFSILKADLICLLTVREKVKVREREREWVQKANTFQWAKDTKNAMQSTDCDSLCECRSWPMKAIRRPPFARPLSLNQRDFEHLVWDEQRDRDMSRGRWRQEMKKMVKGESFRR